MAVPALVYGNESWNMKKKDKSKLQNAEIRFSSRVKYCMRRDLIQNGDLRDVLDIFKSNL